MNAHLTFSPRALQLLENTMKATDSAAENLLQSSIYNISHLGLIYVALLRVLEQVVHISDISALGYKIYSIC